MQNAETTPPAASRKRRWGRVLLWSLGTGVLLLALLVLGLYLTADSWAGSTLADAADRTAAASA
ncbi:MAG: hypothetical protein ACO1TE_29370 [Prosthecobacter sp.]